MRLSSSATSRAMRSRSSGRAGPAGQQLDRHADPRERTAQLVRGGGEHGALHRDQRLDPFGGAIEALGEIRDLVGALDVDPGTQIAGAERVHSRLQPFEPAGDAARKRICADGDDDGERHQQPEPVTAGAPEDMRRQPSAVRQAEQEDRTALAVLPFARGLPGLRRRRDRRPRRRDQGPVGAVEREPDPEVVRDLPEGGGECGGVVGQRPRDEVGHRVELAPVVVVVVVHQPPERDDDPEDHDDGDEVEIDPEVELSHEREPSERPFMPCVRGSGEPAGSAAQSCSAAKT